MAYFAEIDENNIVVQVIVVDNEDIKENGEEKEAKGVAFCKNLLGQGKTWVQTSYNWSIRKQYAGIGYKYDVLKDKFIAPQPYPSWSLDLNDDWQAPLPYPKDGEIYDWDEKNTKWQLI
jgi:hypothetical protein